MFQIQPCHNAFGVATVVGIDAIPDDAAASEIRTALVHAGILCLRFRRPLQDPELQAVARLFGPIKDPVARAKDGAAFRYSEPRQIIDSGFVMTDEIREKLGSLTFGGLDDQRPGLFETFHCDDTYTQKPAAATLLHARQLPPSGGGPTLFLDMRAAHALLDAPTKARLESLKVVYQYNNLDAFPPRRSASGPADVLEEVLHPLLRTHPATGMRSLFLDLDRASHVDGLSLEEGRRLLQSLQDHAEANAPRCQHDWHEHDVLVWDNRSVQHKAGSDFCVGEPRRFWRYMIAGERPV
jgi:alpha-ketoglutarate-dependent taurine dioxygenase